MTTTRLRKVIVFVLVLVALWPAVHHRLAARYELDPWEFFGWSMYAVPLPRVQAGFEELVGGEIRLVSAVGEERIELRRYARMRTTIGEFADDEAFARWLLDRAPEREGITLLLRRWQLDRKTARLGFTDRRLVFEREPAPGSSAADRPTSHE